jgi:hypothetical protein
VSSPDPDLFPKLPSCPSQCPSHAVRHHQRGALAQVLVVSRRRRRNETFFDVTFSF